jgi:hypothetical protein
MLTKTERLNSLTRALRPAALALLCAAAAPAAQAQIVRDPQPPIHRGPLPPVGRSRLPPIGGDLPPGERPPGGDAPTMKKPDAVEVPASRARRSYDPKRDATYVNVDVTLLAHRDVKEPKGAVRFEGREVTLTFQLAYRGRQTYDLVSAYLIVESTTLPAESEKLAAVNRLSINADPYEYAYERADYQTDTVAPVGALTQQLRKEIAAFKLPTEDLPQLANAGRLLVKLGPESFTVKSPQLSELRRTLADGASR